jgi:hypothetical protein
MSEQIDNIVPFPSSLDSSANPEPIFDEFIGVCECCGTKADLRPYGAYGAWICYECGQQDPEATENRAYNVMNEESCWENES